MINIETKLKLTRKLTGFTQKHVANKSGISVMSYYRYEHGKRIPRSDVLQQIAKALGTTPDKLLE